VLIKGERHLQRALREYVAHYNHERPHRGIDLEVPVAYSNAGVHRSGPSRASRPARRAAARVPHRRLILRPSPEAGASARPHAGQFSHVLTVYDPRRSTKAGGKRGITGSPLVQPLNPGVAPHSR
jgi:hypothetical protein